ncbi:MULTISPECIES: hydrogenase nickel incorporation protein HypB [Helicobacter]|uniref:Hydrogenase nickel incorporation protein HypB n=1 Tax=Helicobacter colisuis TaxID=2949739 RepID=A0ABT0TTE9_9HELI|nr:MULTISPECIES: hydrogenase nickel incorporation protein HypB [Helicobacter]MCI2235886.1 hydrogenase nickel incorporation protein HypB [Helicobacter sp. CaF467b]MCI7047962.1 hydrogenase nickel incorporation protein HypB [Helicobacter sp.]MCI7765300.1 hydrogenase nickel incorporation protein HypB [Helicobacter sp.]MCL9819199.1 hydrogenase nickel incorporation protein HypB [Helicobacter colisuis]MCL9821356.1 hydrogenase nickel incorporation protein HypB [Helicobacter colisuis]
MDNLSKKSIEVGMRILSKNDEEAIKLRQTYQNNDLFVVNLMSSPGSGKTTLLENIAKNQLLDFSVIEGDLQTNRDAERLAKYGVNAYQITTGEACHLEALMVKDALEKLQEQGDFKKFLFIENVGNLVCPASYDLGANMNIVLLSTSEGDDKVLKYPTIFLCADAVVISKSDLIEVFEFQISRVKEDLEKLKKEIPLFLISKNNSDSIREFCEFLKSSKEKNYVSSHTF